MMFMYRFDYSANKPQILEWNVFVMILELEVNYV